MKLGRIAASIAGIVAVAAAGIGWMIARKLTAPPSGRVFDLTVLGVVPHGERLAIILDRTTRTAAAGRYNVWLEDGGWVHVGEVVHEDDSTVTRLVEGNVPASLEPGIRASWSGIYYRDPEDAGLDAVDIAIDTPAGPAPAWLIEPLRESDRWAVHVHGLGSPRAGTLRGVEVAANAGLTSLVVSYRNDGEGPAACSGRSTLGVTEMEDVREALRYATAHGASRIVLFGWSMGAAIALELARSPEFREVVEGVVLESPVLDWRSTIDANCVRAGLPSWFGALAGPWLQNRFLSRVVGLQAAVPLDRFDWLGRADQLCAPMLILHGVDDTSTPFEVSRRLSDLRPDLVRLEPFRADHTMSWSAAPDRWRFVLREWLASGADHAS